jgi:hypothetical protein
MHVAGRPSRGQAGAFLIAVLLASVPALAAEKLKPEEVIARHLEAMGAAEGRTASRATAGSCALGTLASRLSGALAGQFRFESAPGRFALKMQFPSDRNFQESFVYENGRADVGFAQPGKRSGLANFLSVNGVILSEGLLGGVLNASWPLQNLVERGARATYDGLKKVEGREVHRLSYRAKKGQGNLEVFLYFEPDTFRHVGSLYKTSQGQPMGSTIESSSQMSDVYFQIQETFSDWKAENGLILPAAWTLQYQMIAGTTDFWKYELTSDTLGR